MYYEKLLKDTERNRDIHIKENPIFSLIYSGEFTKWHYLAYLRETYFLVEQTPEYLKLCAKRLDVDPWLKKYYSDFATEENGHCLLCVNDIKALNENPDIVLRGMPSGGTWAMITQNYYFATVGKPCALIGDNVATEGLGVSLATEIADIFEIKYKFPRNSTTFLRVHGEEDIEHQKEAIEAVEKYCTETENYNQILDTWRKSLLYYGQLFKDVIDLGNLWSQQGLNEKNV